MQQIPTDDLHAGYRLLVVVFPAWCFPPGDPIDVVFPAADINTGAGLGAP
jgi:hypothetical protein